MPSISWAHSCIAPFHSVAAYNIISAVGPSLAFVFHSLLPFAPCFFQTEEKLAVQGFWYVISPVVAQKVWGALLDLILIACSNLSSFYLLLIV